MIRLCVEDYCQDCPRFEPKTDVTILQVESFDPFGDDVVHAETRVLCEHRSVCAGQMRWFKEHANKN